MAADAAIRHLRRIARDPLAAITVAADHMGVPVTMPAPVVGTRVRTEATDAKPHLILTNAALQSGRRFSLP
jgi:hypothetical protein